MRSALIARLEALHTAYVAMELPELAERARAARRAIYRTVDPESICDITIDLGRAVEASCITPAAELADGLFELGYAFGMLADGIEYRESTNWRRGCCRWALATASRLAERMAERA